MSLECWNFWLLPFNLFVSHLNCMFICVQTFFRWFSLHFIIAQHIHSKCKIISSLLDSNLRKHIPKKTMGTNYLIDKIYIIFCCWKIHNNSSGNDYRKKTAKLATASLKMWQTKSQQESHSLLNKMHKLHTFTRKPRDRNTKEKYYRWKKSCWHGERTNRL